jgi:hypothetical protein
MTYPNYPAFSNWYWKAKGVTTLDDRENLGFTLLCGGRCPSRFTAAAWGPT